MDVIIFPPEFKDKLYHVYQEILQQDLKIVSAYQETACQLSEPNFSIRNYIHSIMEELHVSPQIEKHAIALGYDSSHDPNYDPDKDREKEKQEECQKEYLAKRKK